MSSVAAKPSTSKSINVAASSGSPARPQDGCKNCVKTGLAILPTRYAVIPDDLSISWSLPTAGFGAGVTDKNAVSHKYVLQTLRAGYLYVYYPHNNNWDCYLVTADGFFKSYPSGKLPLNPEKENLSESCKRFGDNIPASVIAIQKPKECTQGVWMAFSDARWTEKTFIKSRRGTQKAHAKD
jgi:hypothetical protein